MYFGWPLDLFIFLLIYCYNAMVKLSFKVMIGKDFETVWRYFSEFSNITQWDPNTPACQVRKSVEGKVGSVYDITSLFNGSESQLVYTTRAYTKTDKEGYISLYGENNMIRALDEITCRSRGSNKTELEYKADICLRGIAVLVTPFILRPLSKLAEVARVGCRDKARELWG